MSNKVVLRPMGSSNHRRQPLLQQSKSSAKASTRLGEVVGGTAAVCCCAPCSLANIVYLAIYKVPASLYLRALNKRKQRRRKRIQASGEGMFPAKRRCTCGCCDDVVGVSVHPTCGDYDEEYGGVKSEKWGVQEEDKDVVELEKEMWDTFYGTGFWRSSSQKNKDSLSFSSQSATPNFQVLIVPT